jgi:phage terminase large subunit-like protein
LEDKGFEFFTDEERDEFMIPIGQGFKDQTRSIELLEKLIIEERLAHGGHPILRWNIGNTVVVRDPAGNRKVQKAVSYGRVDGMIALALAAHAWGEFEIADEGPSIYDNVEDGVFM